MIGIFFSLEVVFIFLETTKNLYFKKGRIIMQGSFSLLIRNLAIFTFLCAGYSKPQNKNLAKYDENTKVLN